MSARNVGSGYCSCSSGGASPFKPWRITLSAFARWAKADKSLIRPTAFYVVRRKAWMAGTKPGHDGREGFIMTAMT
jgi:hypothetical protein